MDKIKIITDSTCDLPKEITTRYNIEVIPLEVHFGDETYKDGIDLKVHELFYKIKNFGIFPTTSQINPQRFFEVYSRYLNEGYKIISIHLSSKMSGTFQSACIAKGMLNTEDIVVIDSLNVTSGLGILVLRAVEYMKQGLNIYDIETNIKNIIPRVKSVLAFDSLEYLVKGGRLPKAVGLVGNVLNIKLILEVKDGEITVMDKVRGTKKAIRKIIDFALKSKVNKIDKPMVLSIFSEDVLNSIKDNFEENGLEYIECEVGCVVGTHSGPGACGIFLIEDD